MVWNRVFMLYPLAGFAYHFFFHNDCWNLFNYVEMIYRNLNAEYAQCSSQCTVVIKNMVSRTMVHNTAVLHNGLCDTKCVETILFFSSLLFPFFCLTKKSKAEAYSYSKLYEHDSHIKTLQCVSMTLSLFYFIACSCTMWRAPLCGLFSSRFHEEWKL